MVKFSKAIAITAQEMVSALMHCYTTALFLFVFHCISSFPLMPDACRLHTQMTKSVTCPEELGGLASQVTVDYGQLAHQGRLAAATAEPEEVRGFACSHVEDVGRK